MPNLLRILIYDYLFFLFCRFKIVFSISLPFSSNEPFLYVYYYAFRYQITFNAQIQM